LLQLYGLRRIGNKIMKRSVFTLFVLAVGMTVSFFLLFAHTLPSAAAASSPDLFLTATPSSGLSNSFYLGQDFTLMLVDAPANATFTICAVFPGGTNSCTPDWGMTDASGSWEESGTWIASTTPVGAWKEQAEFPVQSLNSNGISFTMAPSGPAVAPTSTLPAAPTSTSPTLPVVTPSPAAQQVPSFLNNMLRSAFSGYTQELQNILNQANNLPSSSPSPSVTPATGFPLTILVTASSLNVRIAPNTTALLAGSGTLYAGDSFTAVNEVAGQSVDGNNLWWVSSLGNYVWSGGTSVVGGGLSPRSTPTGAPSITSAQGFNPTAGATSAYEAAMGIVNTGDTYLILYGSFASSGNTVAINGQALPAGALTYQTSTQINVAIGSSYAGVPFTVTVSDANGASLPIGVNGATVATTPPPSSLPSPVTKTVSSGGASYSVTYSYLADGEVRAAFTYKGKPYVEQNFNSFHTSGGAATVESDGSFGFPYSGQADTTLETLASQISTDSPPNQTVFPGFVFSTPLYYTVDVNPYYVDVPVNAFSMTASAASNVPVPNIYYLTTVTNGDLIAVTPISFPGAFNASYVGPVVATGKEIAVQYGVIPPVSTTQVIQRIRSASSLGQAISVAEEAGLTIAPWSGDGVNGVVVSDPKTGETLAAITEWTDFVTGTTSTVSFGQQFLGTLAFSVSTPADSVSISGDGNILGSIFSIALADNTNATAVGNDTGTMADCDVAGTGGAANIFVLPNGQISGGGASSYAFSTQCNLATGCVADQASLASAQNFINGLGVSPLTSNSPSDSQIEIQIQNSLPEAVNATGIATTISTLNPDGTFANTCNANIGMTNVAKDAAALGLLPNSAFSENYFTNVIIHEVLHCMGLGHNANPLDIMCGDAADLQWALNPPSIDPAEVAVLRQIAAGQTIQVENCQTMCEANEGEVVAMNGSQDDCKQQSELCPDTSQLWDFQTQSCETCQQLGYPDGWSANQGDGTCSLVVSGGSAPQVPLEPSPSSEAPVCYCTSDGAVCLDSGGDKVATPSSGFSCPSGIRPGAVCTCFLGNVSCIDTDGNPANSPTGFQCFTSGSGTGPGDIYPYACSDSNQCVYVGSGGQYSDSSCDDACG